MIIDYTLFDTKKQLFFIFFEKKLTLNKQCDIIILDTYSEQKSEVIKNGR